MDETPPDDLARRAIELLIALHSHKTVGYGNAWRRRGELLSIFTNIARKYDRLVVALDEHLASPDERLVDTAGDLCVYAGKYLTWLAEQHPEAFDAGSDDVTSGECADYNGPAALANVLRALHIDGGAGVAECWCELKAAFGPLDAGLSAQAAGDPPLTWAHKVELAWATASSAAALLLALAQKDPAASSAWREEIEALG